MEESDYIAGRILCYIPLVRTTCNISVSYSMLSFTLKKASVEIFNN